MNGRRVSAELIRVTGLRGVPSGIGRVVCLFALCTAGFGESPKRDPLEEMESISREEESRAGGNDARRAAADRLFASDDWQKRMARDLAEWVEKSWVTDDDANWFAVGNAPPEFREKILKDNDANKLAAAKEAMERASNAIGPRAKVHRALQRLSLLRDRRVVPFIAPLLAETTPSLSGDDYSIGTPQAYAADALRFLAQRGVIKKPSTTDRCGGFTVEIWRNWWDANREKFEPVPEPLQRLNHKPKPEVLSEKSESKSESTEVK